MNTFDAFAKCRNAQGSPRMVFDWDRAATRIAATRPTEARAGLSQDWEWTGGPIYRDGDPVPREDTYTYLASNWAVPELDLDGVIEPCYQMLKATQWDENTYWPESALQILRADKENSA